MPKGSEDKGALAGIEYSCESPLPENCFSFKVNEQGDAFVLVYTFDGESASLPFSDEDMNALRELVGQYGIESYLESYKKPLFDMNSSSGDVYSTSLIFDGGRVLSAPSAGSWGNGLMTFFLKYVNS